MRCNRLDLHTLQETYIRFQWYTRYQQELRLSVKQTVFDLYKIYFLSNIPHPSRDCTHILTHCVFAKDEANCLWRVQNIHFIKHTKTHSWLYPHSDTLCLHRRSKCNKMRSNSPCLSQRHCQIHIGRPSLCQRDPTGDFFLNFWLSEH